jgi:6-phosphogluconate dehydrogenase (decarboxylating)
MLANEKITLFATNWDSIGLGYLGSRITRRLVAAGFPMVVYDRDHTKAAELQPWGPELRGIPESWLAKLM